jgi:hypothetical protein
MKFYVVIDPEGMQTVCEKETDVVGGRKLKFMSCFMETAHGPLHLLDEWNLVEQ